MNINTNLLALLALAVLLSLSSPSLQGDEIPESGLIQLRFDRKNDIVGFDFFGPADWLASQWNAKKIHVFASAKEVFLRQHAISVGEVKFVASLKTVCLLYTSPSPRDRTRSRMPSSA